MNVLFIGNGFDLAHGIKVEFKNFVDSNHFKEKIKTYKNFFTREKYEELCKGSDLWSKFEDFCYEICESNPKIKCRSFFSKIAAIFQEWFRKEDFDSLKATPYLPIIKLLDKNKIDVIVSFNFTKTAEIYGYTSKFYTYKSTREEWEVLTQKTFINIHQFEPSKTKKFQYILGHDAHSRVEKRFFISKWESAKPFDPKEQLLKSITQNPKIQKLIFYGFSFGDSDRRIKEFSENFVKGKSNKRKIVICYKNQKPKINNSKKIDFCEIQ